MNNELKKLNKYLLNNGFKKEAENLNIIVRSSLSPLFGLFLTTLFGCNNKHLVFDIPHPGTFAEYQNNFKFEDLSLNATLNATIYRVVGSFENINDTQEATRLIDKAFHQGCISQSQRQLFYDGDINRDNLIPNKYKDLKVCYYNIIFDQPSNWNSNSKIVHDDSGNILENNSEVTDGDIASKKGYDWESWIFTEGLTVLAPGSDSNNDPFAYVLNKGIANTHMEYLMEKLKKKTKKIGEF